MKKLQGLLAIKRLIVLVPILLVFLVSVGMSIVFYKRDYNKTIGQALQLSTVSVQPIINLMSLSVGGGNYANLQNEDALKLFASNKKILFFETQGKTDTNGTPFSVVYDAKTREVWRTYYDEEYVSKLESRLEKSKTKVAALAKDDPKYEALNKVLQGFIEEHDRYEKSGKIVKDIYAKYKKPTAAQVKDGYYFDDGKLLLHVLVPTSNSGGGNMWLVMDMSEMDKLIKEILYNVIIVVAIALVVATILSLFTSRLIINPLRRISEGMIRLTKGDNQFEIGDKERRDEIGEMSRALQVFKDGQIEKLRLEEEKRKEMERKEIRQRKVVELINSFEDKVKASISQVSGAASNLHKTSESMSNIMQDAFKNVSEADDASKETEQNVQMVATAAEEMAASIREITTQVTRSAQVVDDAVDKANKTDDIIRSLSSAAESIGEIVELITSIAGKINLLALNATIEAERAGEAGRGFAVVASEVKSLAGQTTNATEQVEDQIENIREVSNNVIDVLSVIKSSVSNIKEYSSSIAAAVEEQDVTTKNIAENMNTAASGVKQVAQNISQVVLSTQGADESASQVLNSAKMLSQQADMLDKEVKSFLSEIQEA